MSDHTEPGVVFVTAPPEHGAVIARGLVQNRLAACVQIVDRVTSIYKWKGTLEEEPEALLVVKTTRKQVQAISAYLYDHHPYDVPECVFVPITAGSEAYLSWLGNETL
ncbi:MAG: divalent-cation tolerance protein CutA [Spirochaetaceae bacterium]